VAAERIKVDRVTRTIAAINVPPFAVTESVAGSVDFDMPV
jgi:hypothetical protein